MIHPDLAPIFETPAARGELILELWSAGFSSPMICSLIGLDAEASVHRVITKARRGGDARAESRKSAGGRHPGGRSGTGQEW